MNKLIIELKKKNKELRLKLEKKYKELENTDLNKILSKHKKIY